MASDTDIAPATVSDLTDMIESRYSGQITPRDLDVAKVAFAAGAAAEREACALLAEDEARAHRPAGGKALNIVDRIRQRGAQ